MVALALARAAFAAVAVGPAGGLNSSPENVSTGHADRTTRTSGVVDLRGQPVDPFVNNGAKAVVLVFVSNDCPISNRYVPELRRLNALYAAKGITFWLVHPDPGETVEAIQAHTQEYQCGIGVLRDPSHGLVKHAQVRVTPEAAVFRANGELLYHGRIDDRYVDFGKERAAATKHDLEDILQTILAGKPIHPSSTRAVGCYIADPK
jgi:hypothetical protein